MSKFKAGKQEVNHRSRIIRAQNELNSFVIDKDFLEDERLSFTAKGILTYLLSKPDDCQVTVADLANHSGDGENTIYSGLNELKDYGYIK